ncbi:unnamed protein product [Brassica oleracea var. botrytis]
MCNSSWTFILSELMISARKREVISTNRLAFSAACGSQDVTSLQVGTMSCDLVRALTL